MNTKSVINVASVPHRSPFRYPGGKTWLVPHVRRVPLAVALGRQCFDHEPSLQWSGGSALANQSPRQ